MSKYSRRNITFLAPLAKFSTVFGFTPSYNFDSNQLTHKKVFKCYSLFLACAFTGFTVFTIIYRIFSLHNKAITFFSVLDTFTELISLVMFLVTTFGAAFWNMDTWHKLVVQLKFLENKSNLNTTHLKAKSLLENASFIFFAGIVCYVFLFIYVIYFWEASILLEITSAIDFLIDYMISTVAFNIVLSIKCKYEDIRHLITYNVCSNDISRVRRLYLTMDEVMEKFNKLFGWPMLGLTIHLFCELLGCLTVFTFEVYNNVNSYVMGIWYILLVAFGPVMLVFSCDLAVGESRKLLITCYKLQEYLPINSKESKELRRLENLLRKKPPVFTASGFFKMNRSTLMNLLNTIATYFIVAIQFTQPKMCS